MSIIDISDYTLDEINNSLDIFEDTSLKDIGMVNCDINTINKVGTLTTATLWVGEHINIADYNGTAPIKTYREDVVKVKLNSPLLEGDSIEVIDGNLCHVHKSNSVVLDGSGDEEWKKYTSITLDYGLTAYYIGVLPYGWYNKYKVISNKFIVRHSSFYEEGEKITNVSDDTRICVQVYKSRLLEDTVNGFIHWLVNNPITLVYNYKLAEPTYENITPLQSEIVLKTFEECNMNIVTNLPIKTNVSYRTNVPSITVLTAQVDEIEKSGTVVANLTDVIEQEIDK